MATTTTDPTSLRRIELILQQVESLPTLPAVAMRLLQLTSDEEADARQVIDLVRSDQAMTAKILSMCQAASVGVRGEALTVDRAVVLLGFDAIRNAVLSIKVFETFAEQEDAPQEQDTRPGFDRPSFWRHCLSVGIAAELIAAAHPEHKELKPTTAFVCGLLHDLGKLALEHVLPKSYDRVIELTEAAAADIAEVERKVLGIDHHTVGKRLAEHWQLPHMLQDCLWLHGTNYEALPDIKHKQMVGLIHVADLVVRRQHIGYSGNHKMRESIEQAAEAAGLDPVRVQRSAEAVLDELERRASLLGLGSVPSRKLFLESIMQANAVLGRLNAQLESRRNLAEGQGRVLEAIARFHERSTAPGRNAQQVLAQVASSAGVVLGRGFYAVLYQAAGDDSWQISQYSGDGRPLRSQLIDPPPSLPRLAEITEGDRLPSDWMSILPWVSDYLMESQDVRQIRMLALPCGWGTAAVLLHDRSVLPAPAQMHALAHTWGAAIAAAAQHEGARRMSEQLAEANRSMIEAQQALARTTAMAQVGEMAAGAAHEMNNPLAVISGRAQLLASTLGEGSKHRAEAQLIYEQSQKLSDLITALHLFADPPAPDMRSIAVVDLLEASVKLMKRRMPDAPAVKVSSTDDLPPLWTDRDQVAGALSELILNANQAEPRSPVQVRIQVDLLTDQLVFSVIDDGVGMDEKTLQHAFDPFYSAKSAGRQPGLGLAKARRLMEQLGGDIDLSSRSGEGTTARLRIPLIDPPATLDRVGDSADESNARPAARGERRALNAQAR
jgi:signal transduction histidine kinase/HD-like signal output (HDOD) protein